MKILIAYAGKTGTTEKCAKLLKELLPGAESADLRREKPDCNGFDVIIAGGAIRVGKINKAVKAFLEKNMNLLMHKKVAVFLCRGFEGELKQTLELNLPKALLDKAVTVDSFGGELEVERLKGMEKFMTKMILKANAEKNIPLPVILEENIRRFAETIKSLE